MRDCVHTLVACAGCACGVDPARGDGTVVSHFPGLGIMRLCTSCAGKLIDEMALWMGQHELVYLRETFLSSMKGGG